MGYVEQNVSKNAELLCVINAEQIPLRFFRAKEHRAISSQKTHASYGNQNLLQIKKAQSSNWGQEMYMLYHME